jgi:hypothetical protein
VLAGRGERARFFASAPAPTGASGGGGMDTRSPPAGDATPQTTGVRTTAPEPHAGFWSARVQRLWWCYYAGPCTDEIWRQYLGTVERMIDSGLDCTLACFAHHADAPSALQRKAMADFIERNQKVLERLDRFALVIDSVVHRGAITALSWLVKKPFAERIFNSPLAAIKWLTETHPELDPEAVRASIVAQVPSHSLWPALAAADPETVSKQALP